MSRGLWRTLEFFAESNPPAAVLAEWRLQAGNDFAFVQHYLGATTRLALDYPCVNDPGCRNRHKLSELDDGRWLACVPAGLGPCRAVPLTRDDLWIQELDAARFGGDAARALGFTPAPATKAVATAPKAFRVGTSTETQSPVFLLVCPSQGQLLANLQGVAGSCGEPFIVLAPTAQVRSELAGSFLQRERCAFIALDSCLAPNGAGFQLTSPVRPILDRFAMQAAPASIAKAESGKRKAETNASPRYSLRKGLGCWELVLDGRRATVDDVRGVHIVAYLLRNPPPERIHAVDLEKLVWAQGFVGETSSPLATESAAELDEQHLTVRSEPSGQTRSADDNELLKREVRELLDIIRDETLPAAEREDARDKLGEISRAMSGSKGISRDAAQAVERVRKSILRLQEQLASTMDEHQQPHEVLRAFAEHIRKYVIVPSARFTKSKTSRNQAGVAGTFTYEPPPGVKWS